MSTEHEAKSSPVEVSAQKLLQNYEGANALSCKLEGAVSIMDILSEGWADRTSQNGALWAVHSMLEECLQMANKLQWTGNDVSRALRALDEQG